MPETQRVRVSYDDGARAVELAREAVESFVQNGQRVQPGSMREAFYNRTGAFVRIESTRGRGRLRGCAAAYGTGDQLGHAIVDAAIAAASADSCGSELTASELSSTQLSVCVVCHETLSADPVADVELGTHGVVVDRGDRHAWLYPTLPVRHGWDEAEYLSRVCKKADLSPTAWQDEDTMVTLFEGQVFRERADGGSTEAL
ncbi:MAG: TIGR00296 family protein [Halolamina sp.]